jgi:hypothetical protein
MNEDILLPFDLPAVRRKKVSAAFHGGRITDGLEMLWGGRRGEGTIVAAKKTDGVPHAAAE